MEKPTEIKVKKRTVYQLSIRDITKTHENCKNREKNKTVETFW